MIEKVQPRELQNILQTGDKCQIVDVREYSEVAAERIEGAIHKPLSSFRDPQLEKERTIYLVCRTGNRAQRAAQQLAEAGYKKIYIVDGGIEAWKAAGLQVVRGASHVWSLERQVRFTAGSLVFLGVILSYAVHPYFLLLSAAIGAGLVFSAATNTCGMGMLLAKMPWNAKSSCNQN
jgi:rhodanese-related sulfurtransferase